MYVQCSFVFFLSIMFMILVDTFHDLLLHTCLAVVQTAGSEHAGTVVCQQHPM
jgi:hypothetical protein